MDNTRDAVFNVEVAYATPAQQEIISVSVPVGCTALQAAQLSGIGKIFPDIDWPNLRLGIFGRSINFDRVLTTGDRVEIYRPLKADPKESRRQRAALVKRQRTRKAT